MVEKVYHRLEGGHRQRWAWGEYQVNMVLSWAICGGAERREEPLTKRGNLGQETGIAKMVELYKGQKNLGEHMPARRPCNS